MEATAHSQGGLTCPAFSFLNPLFASAKRTRENKMLPRIPTLCALILCFAASAAYAQEKQDTVDTRLGPLTLDHGLPTPETRQKLYDELDFQRGVQGVLWAEPAINNALFLKAMQRAGVPNLGAMVYDARMQPGQETLTPNQSVVYLYDYINLKDTGPVVYILPPGPINAGFFDAWMRAVLDLGIVGPHKGKGDRIVILPPGYAGVVPEGYLIARPKTFRIFSITRITVKEGMTAEQAVEIFRKIQTYRLADASNPPAKTLVMMGDPKKGGKEFRMNRPSGLDYWRLVHEIINQETVEDRDRIMRGTLSAIGIAADKPFAPDDRMQKILVDAERVGKLMMINEAFSPRSYPDGIVKDMYPGTHWENIQLLPSLDQEGPNSTYVTERMIGFYQANGAQFIWAPQDFPPGFGQKYMAAYKDKSGDWLKGEYQYRLHVPPKVPVKDFAALTVYDVATRALIETPQHRAEINPNLDKLKVNPDGSVDLYFGPTAPQGMESNWTQTIPGKSWFAYFRLYGPTEGFYDKSWALPDIERTK
jgi:hypothetical protein